MQLVRTTNMAIGAVDSESCKHQRWFEGGELRKNVEGFELKKQEQEQEQQEEEGEGEGEEGEEELHLRLETRERVQGSRCKH